MNITITQIKCTVLMWFLALASSTEIWLEGALSSCIPEYFKHIVLITDRESPQPSFVSTDFYVSIAKIYSGIEQWRHQLYKDQVLVAKIVAISNVSLLQDWMQQELGSIDRWTGFYLVQWPNSPTDLQEITQNFTYLMPLDSDFYWIFRHGNNSNSLWESYSVKGVHVMQYITTYSDEKDVSLVLIGNKLKRRRNFHGASIVGTAVDDAIYAEEVSFRTRSDGSKVFHSGLSVDIFRILRDYFNFSESDMEGEYMLGTLTTGGRVERTQFQLSKGEADISITAQTVVSEKADEARFLHPIYSSWLELRFIDPLSKWRMFMAPCSSKIWLLILIHSTVMVITASLFRLLTEEHREELPSAAPCEFLWILSTLCLQGWHAWPHSTSLRILFLVASVTGFLFNACYSGALTSQLSVRQSSKVTAENLRDLNYLFYVEEDIGTPIVLQGNGSTVRIHNVVNRSDGLSALMDIRRKNSALISFPEFYYSTTEFGNYTHTEVCNLCTAVRYSTKPSVCAMAVSKSSELKESFNILLLIMREHGILFRLSARYKDSKILKCNADSRAITAQSLEELALAFTILAVGMIISLVLLLAEKIVYSVTYSTNSYSSGLMK